MFRAQRRLTGRVHRRGRLVFFAVMLLATIVVAVTAGSAPVVGAAQADPPAGTPGQPPANWTDTTVPMGLEMAVEKMGAGQFASNYGGIAVINNQSQIAVYLTSPTSAIEQALQALAPSGMLVFRSTPNTQATIEGIHQQIEGEWQTLVEDGIDVVDFGPDVTLGQEDVGVENLTSAEAQQLQAQFAPGALHIYNETAASVNARYLNATTRQNDVAPYNGGDDVSDAGKTGTCSTGFGVMISGSPRIVSAGHCWNSGTNVINWPTSGRSMGSVTNNGLGQFRGNQGDNNLDSMVISGCDGTGSCGGDGVIWTGAIGNPQRSNVSGVGTWAVGDQVCESGAVGGEQCDFTVADPDHCITISGYNLCQITTVNVTGGQNAIPGDSGGPWFRFSGSNLDIVGTDTGGGPGISFFTGVNRILSHWNACLITVGFGCVS
jgi:hypothetical protein